MNKYLLILASIILIGISVLSSCIKRERHLLHSLKSPIIFNGDSVTAYRDPAALFNTDTFYLFFTVIEIESDGMIYAYTAQSKSNDLIYWNTPKKITPKDQQLNYSSPGNIIRFNNEWILCLQTYPRPGYTVDQMIRYGTAEARLFIMRSTDLEHWSEPEMLKVRGPYVPVSEMGRMIDPYLLEDKEEKGKWWCFYKQHGVSMSFTYDFLEWEYFGHIESGENVSLLVEDNQYVLFHSPQNGIGIKKSDDLKSWKDWGELITLGQLEWTWARGRVSAGTVIKLPENRDANYLMFFHGSGPLTEVEGDFDKNASIGIAWSSDLKTWDWPGKAID